MKIKIFILQLLLQLTFHSHAQEILGTVTDQKKEPLINASVRVTQSGTLKASTVTDFDGKYSVKPLDPGLYDVAVSYTGFRKQTITGVVVTAGDKTLVNFTLPADKESATLKCVEIRAYKKPLIDPYRNNTILTGPEIRTKPTTSTTDLTPLAPGVYQSRRGADINTDGARSNEEYKKVLENDFLPVKNNPLSTMSVDVDRASYSNVRRFITEGQRPPADAVRIEEMINYFNYNYPKPTKDAPVGIETELVGCPWNNNHFLLRVGIQAKTPEVKKLPPSNLVFLIDVSGSMDEPNKLPLLKSSLKLLVNQLRKEDKVSIVVYAGNAGLVLPPTSGSNKHAILNAIKHLEAGGSTAGGAGIMLAYNVAKENFIEGGNNRVILATDGDFNVGISNDNELEALITEKRKSGIFLTCLGFGEGNYKDAKMETLADKGNGNYDYIDNLDEAKKTLVNEFKGTMFTVAKDVKAQIEFNPAKIQGYRLVGYENRLLNTEDFKDDRKDAGDMGAGHSVTILYELVPAGMQAEATPDNSEALKYQKAKPANDAFTDEIATIKFRYKQPAADESKLMSQVILNESKDFNNATENTRFAASVAMFGMLLKSSKYKGNCSYSTVLEIAKGSKGKDEEGYRAEMIELVAKAKGFWDNAGTW